MLTPLLSRARGQNYSGEIKSEPLQLSQFLSSWKLKSCAYDIQSDGALADERLHFELGPDGMPLDAKGNSALPGKT